MEVSSRDSDDALDRKGLDLLRTSAAAGAACRRGPTGPRLQSPNCAVGGESEAVRGSNQPECRSPR